MINILPLVSLRAVKGERLREKKKKKGGVTPDQRCQIS